MKVYKKLNKKIKMRAATLAFEPGELPKKPKITFHPYIRGNIDRVIERLNLSENFPGILLDIRCFRSLKGLYTFRGDEDLNHNAVLDKLADQGGILVLEIGDMISFTYEGKVYVRAWCAIQDGQPYLRYGIFREESCPQLDEDLKKLRALKQSVLPG